MNRVLTSDHFEADRIGDVTIIRFSPNVQFLSEDNARDIALSLRMLMDGDTPKMLFDLQCVQAICSLFFLVVLPVLQSIRQVNGRFALCNLQRPVIDVFQLSHIDPEPPRIFNTLEEALDYLAD